MLSYSYYDFQSCFNIIVLLSIFILFYLYFYPPSLEHMTNSQQLDYEAISNLSSMYKSGKLTVSDLDVTNNLSVNGNSQLGNWNIRNDRIGIKNRGDIQLSSDNWLRLLYYDGNDFIGSDKGGGFASKNISVQNNITTDNLSTTNNLNIAKNLSVGGSTTLLGNASGPNLITNDIAIGIQSSRGGYLVDAGGWSTCNPVNAGNWQTMRLVKLPFNPNPITTFGSCCGC